MLLSQIIELDCLSNCKIVAGKSSIKFKKVEGITIMEAPDIADWIKGGELILTSLYSVCEDEQQMEALVRRLAENGAAGLLVKVGRFIERVPEAVVNAGDIHQLPVIQIAGDVKYVDIMYPVMNELFNRQLVLLEHYRHCHDRFIQLTLQNGSLDDIAAELKRILRRPVIIFDRDLETLAFTDELFSAVKKLEGKKECVPQRTKGTCALYRQKVVLGFESPLAAQMILASVSFFHEEKAYLGIVADSEMGEMEFIAIETAVTNVALELMKHMAVAEVEQKYQNELMDEIIHHRYQSPEEVRFRSRALGWSLDQPHTVILLQIQDHQEQLRSESGISALKNQMHRIHGIIRRISVHYTQHLIISRKSYRILMLFPMKDHRSSAVLKFARELQSQVSGEVVGVKTVIGIGTTSCNVEEIRKSYEEALNAIHFGQRVQNQNNIISYEELGIFKLLCQFGDVEGLHKFIHPGLKKLCQYDQGRANELIDTLEAYLNHQGNAKKTAENLFIHYKTVMYRIKRIKEIMEVDFEDRQVKLEIEVGLKILHMLRENNHPGGFSKITE
ncbi:PucR family transcriptional regulator [Anoxynatronum sibiricum]|uniref:PucR family transcriptional regulator ligand-binding domain-containing protein n=1 Tax=Anoxynatronum sibiricum TaxID=210623 RepID=A0ABU9VVL2_9CLOT